MTYKDCLIKAAAERGFDMQLFGKIIADVDREMPGVGDKELSRMQIESTMKRIGAMIDLLKGMGPDFCRALVTKFEEAHRAKGAKN